MKTIQKGETIKRVSDTEAESQVKHKGFSYVPKSVYKAANQKKTNTKESDSKPVPAPEPKSKKNKK